MTTVAASGLTEEQQQDCFVFSRFPNLRKIISIISIERIQKCLNGKRTKDQHIIIMELLLNATTSQQAKFGALKSQRIDTRTPASGTLSTQSATSGSFCQKAEDDEEMRQAKSNSAPYGVVLEAEHAHESSGTRRRTWPTQIVSGTRRSSWITQIISWKAPIVVYYLEPPMWSRGPIVVRDPPLAEA